ncbi:hypothetical protein ACFR9U_18375 [Halorientalis brevis]|uniref:Lipoprotein n=1 Tax=Halorientalis brevis TaxID=1126241 RepID=A0ABD6CI00_9EURY|nr:hypothetical protein [Halorientalis brevis]
MNRRTVALLVLAALTALSGCAGFLGADSTETPTTNATAGSETPVHDLPLNSSTVLDANSAALTDAGSFTYHQNATVRLTGNESGIVNYKNVTGPTNLTTDRIFTHERIALQPRRDTYVDGNGTMYQRLWSSQDTAYRVKGGATANATPYLEPPLRGHLSGLNFSAAGTSSVDGVTVDTYTVTDLSQVDRQTHDTKVFPAQNLGSISVTVAIDRRGIVRSFDYHATGTNANGDALSYHLSLGYTDVGSTTVAEPEWLSEARNATE